MKWQVFRVAEIERLASAWDELNDQVTRSPLLTSTFLKSALDMFGSGRERLACLGEPHAPLAMAIICERRSGVWETFQPSQAPMGFWLMRPGVEFESALSSLVRALPGFALMAGVTQQDPDLLPRPDHSAQLQTLDYIDTGRIEVAGAFDTYWDDRGKNLRQNMRKARNKLEKAGLQMRLVCLTDADAVRGAIEHYGRMESASWKGKEGTAVHLDNDQGRFYCNLLETHCRAGTGRIYQLMFDDRVVAMDLCVHYQEQVVILKTTYDEQASEYSPAMLMHQELFKSIFDGGEFRRIEFYGKVMDWHRRFTDDIRRMYHVNYYRWGWLKRLHTRHVASEVAAASETT